MAYYFRMGSHSLTDSEIHNILYQYDRLEDDDDDDSVIDSDFQPLLED